MEILLNSYEIKILKLLAKHNRKAPELEKITKGLDFKDTTKNLWAYKLMELVHGPGKIGPNTQYRITSNGKIWLTEHHKQNLKRVSPFIISNVVSFIAGVGSGLLVAYLSSLFGWI